MEFMAHKSPVLQSPTPLASYKEVNEIIKKTVGLYAKIFEMIKQSTKQGINANGYHIVYFSVESFYPNF